MIVANPGEQNESFTLTYRKQNFKFWFGVGASGSGTQIWDSESGSTIESDGFAGQIDKIDINKHGLLCSKEKPMSKREQFSIIENESIGKKSFEERTKDLPEIRARVERMLDLIENAAGDVEKAAEAEMRVTEELRQMGNEALHGWARRQEQKKEEKFNNKDGVNRKEKKTSIGSLDSAKSKL
jgi:hypothetical protein